MKTATATPVTSKKTMNAHAAATIAEINKAAEAADKVAEIEADIYDAEIAKAEIKAAKKADQLLKKEAAKEAKKAERAAKLRATPS